MKETKQTKQNKKNRKKTKTTATSSDTSLRYLENTFFSATAFCGKVF